MCAQLTVHTSRTETENRFDTHWAVGGKQGVIEVTLADQVPQDRAIVAELVALQHLLSRKGVVGCDRNGQDLQLQVIHSSSRLLTPGNYRTPLTQPGSSGSPFRANSPGSLSSEGEAAVFFAYDAP
jgi:hypothetical protein